MREISVRSIGTVRPQLGLSFDYLMINDGDRGAEKVVSAYDGAALRWTRMATSGEQIDRQNNGIFLLLLLLFVCFFILVFLFIFVFDNGMGPSSHQVGRRPVNSLAMDS